MLGDTKQNDFLNDEKLKRAVGMTVINIGELVKNVSEINSLAVPCFTAILLLSVSRICTARRGAFFKKLQKR